MSKSAICASEVIKKKKMKSHQLGENICKLDKNINYLNLEHVKQSQNSVRQSNARMGKKICYFIKDNRQRVTGTWMQQRNTAVTTISTILHTH